MLGELRYLASAAPHAWSGHNVDTLVSFTRSCCLPNSAPTATTALTVLATLTAAPALPRVPLSSGVLWFIYVKQNSETNKRM